MTAFRQIFIVLDIGLTKRLRANFSSHQSVDDTHDFNVQLGTVFGLIHRAADCRIWNDVRYISLISVATFHLQTPSSPFPVVRSSSTSKSDINPSKMPSSFTYPDPRRDDSVVEEHFEQKVRYTQYGLYGTDILLLKGQDESCWT